MTLNNKKGFTLIELLIVTAIISIVAVVAIPQFNTFKTRAYDADAQSNLRSVYTACKEFWTFSSSISPCLLTNVTNTGFGFIPSDDIEVTIESDANNNEYDFYATASHTSSSNIFEIDYRGVVSNTIAVYEQNGGNNGGGCSEQAHDNSHDLRGNAAGGCGTNTGTNTGNNGGNNDGNNGGWKQWWKQWWK